RGGALRDLTLLEELFRTQCEKYNKRFAAAGVDTLDVDAEWAKVKEAASYNSANTPNGKNFLEAVKAIKDILENTQEWKALPDYEFYYH
ncbi:MAG: hypothetical protein IKZ03_04285, partial [Clostridia bacterium]|nr:hypothetical protein [Clostridia bacterium]